ncbi:MAG TPA: MFS transporter [Steroidobacteraceae bacterium]|nr:MFS transporter [Steroidobacteraceae bacterium]
MIESDFSLRKMKIAGAVLLGQMFASSLLPMMALTLVFVPITTEFKWTPTQFGYATTALMWCGGLVGPLLGYLVDRTGVRLMIIGGTVIVGLITIAISFTQQLWYFYLCFGLLGFFGTTAIGYAKVLTALFTQHRGKALALFGLESSLAAAFLPQLIQSLLGRFGWRGLFVIMGLTIIALVPLLYFTLEEPGVTGGSRRLFSRRERTAQQPGAALPELEGLTAREVFRTRTYWLIVVAILFAAVPGNGLMTFLVPVLGERGFAPADAATYLSVFTIAGAIGTIVGGFVLDRIDTAKISVPFTLCSMASFIILARISAGHGGPTMLHVAAALFGFSFGAHRPMGQFFHTRFFGLRSFTTVFAVQMALMALLFGIAPPLTGHIREATGSYDVVIWASVAGLAVAALLYLVLPPYRFAKHIGVITQPQAGPEPAKPIDFAQRSAG